MSIPEKTKPQGAKPGVSETAFALGVPFKNTRRLRKYQVDGLPPLESLDYEVAVLRALILMPSPELLYSKNHTLNGHRMRSLERVARAALRAGHEPGAVVSFLLATTSHLNPGEFDITEDHASEVVNAEVNRPHRRVLGYAGPTATRVIAEFR